MIGGETGALRKLEAGVKPVGESLTYGKACWSSLPFTWSCRAALKGARSDSIRIVTSKTVRNSGLYRESSYSSSLFDLCLSLFLVSRSLGPYTNTFSY